jgi:MFS transporter, DHA1 family, multidrug resistance protein
MSAPALGRPDGPIPDSAAVHDGAATGSGKARLSLTITLGALSAFAPLSIDMYLPALPSLQGSLHASASQTQLTLTAVLIGLAFGQLLAGPLSDKYGRRLPLLVGVAAYAVVSLVCALAPDIAALSAARLLQGGAGAAGIVIARAIVRDLYSGNALATFFAALMLVNGVAPVAAPLIGSQLLKVTDWRGVFVVLSVIGAGLVAAVFFLVPETLPAARRHTGGLAETARSFRELACDRAFLGYAAAGGFGFAAMFAYISGSPFVVEQVYGLSAQSFSFMFAANAVGLIAFGQLSGRLVGRVRPVVLLRAGLVQIAVGGLALLGCTLAGAGFAATAVCLWVTVSAIGLITPNSAALALADHGAKAGTASGFLGVTQFLIGAFAAPLTGPRGASTLARTLPMASVVAVLAVLALGVHLALNRAPAPLQGRLRQGDPAVR